MEEYFVSQTSAIAWVLTERQELIWREEEGAPGGTGRDREARIAELTQLLFDVRAGRTVDFVLPTSRGPVRVLITPD